MSTLVNWYDMIDEHGDAGCACFCCNVAGYSITVGIYVGLYFIFIALGATESVAAATPIAIALLFMLGMCIAWSFGCGKEQTQYNSKVATSV